MMKSFLLYSLLFIVSTAYSQQSDSLLVDTVKTRKVKVLPVPAFGYSPETRAYIGAVVLFTLDFYSDSLTRTSNAKVEFNYTRNKQSILEAQWNYFFKEEKWFTDGTILYSKYPDLYYGIGSHSKSTDELTFNSNRLVLKMNGLKKIKQQLFAGLGVRYVNYSKVSSDSVSPFPELTNNENFEVSARSLYDTRNNLLNATTGAYASFSIGYNTGTRADYLKTILDLRKYYTVKDKVTFALRLLNEWNTNEPSFYDLSLMGGDKNGRGYYYGRYRDHNLSTLQLETRIDLFWRIDMAVFGGLSSVYSSFKHMNAATIVPNYGVGLRFLTDKTEKINLRFDYALGIDGQSGFYVSFGESF